jgi:hypothetical protein
MPYCYDGCSYFDFRLDQVAATADVEVVETRDRDAGVKREMRE